MSDPAQIQPGSSNSANFDAAARVEVALGGASSANEADHTNATPGESLRDLLLRFAGSCSGPTDMSRRHDFYAHETPDE